MTSIERIKLAEDQVAEIQRALSAVQTGLSKVDSVVTAAEGMKARSERTMRLTLGLVVVSILLGLWSLRRGNKDD